MDLAKAKAYAFFEIIDKLVLNFLLFMIGICSGRDNAQRVEQESGCHG
jgi:hypothetical protein